VDVFVMVIALT